jgi:hypothetical protein
MKILNTEFEWNNKYKCDAFIEIDIIPSINVGDIVGINLVDKIVTTAKCLEKIETKMSKLTQLVCMVNSGYNKDFFTSLKMKMHPHVTDWVTQPIYIYVFSTKYSLDDKNDVHSSLIKYL